MFCQNESWKSFLSSVLFAKYNVSGRDTGSGAVTWPTCMQFGSSNPNVILPSDLGHLFWFGLPILPHFIYFSCVVSLLHFNFHFNSCIFYRILWSCYLLIYFVSWIICRKKEIVKWSNFWYDLFDIYTFFFSAWINFYIVIIFILSHKKQWEIEIKI